MKTNNNIPAYRFQGFNDEWNEKMLEEISEKVKEKNSENLYSETFTNSAEFGIVSQKDFFDKDISNELNLNSYYVVRNNDFVYNPRISNLAPVGPIKRNKLGRSGVMSPLYYVFRLHSVDYTYLEKYFDTIFWHKFMYLNGDSGARADRFSIRDSVFAKMQISLPTLPEQEAIGTFFSTLDQHITLHQRKLDTLKEQKKTYLKLLFPAKGQTKPALRFQGFEDDWEEVKLGEILKERNEQIAENEEYPLMSFVQGVGVTPKGERYDRSFLVKEDNKKYKKTELGDFIYSSNNLETGSIGFNKTGKAVISPVYSIFYSKDEFESSFIGILSQRKDFIAKMIKFRQGVVYGQWRIHENDFLQILLHIPTKAEMEKIITFFQTLDQEITQVEDKLASLKEMKKTLLRKLFV